MRTVYLKKKYTVPQADGIVSCTKLQNLELFNFKLETGKAA